MSSLELSVTSIFTSEGQLNNQTINIVNGRIKSIRPLTSQDETVIAGNLVPGFIDVQVNGGGGYLFNDSPHQDCLEKIGRAHLKFGTTGWLPTLVTDSLEKMTQAADAVAKSINTNRPSVLGIHFEGPHLTLAKKGVHSEQYIREISQAEMALFKRTDLGKVVVTLAPETVTTKTIQELVEAGVIVSLGHSNASYEQTRDALDAGATGFTHLYNAMSGLNSREPGMVGAALSEDQSYSGLILDGIHVHPQAARVAINSKTNIMLVTDAMPPVGSDSDCFEFFGQTICRDNNTLRDNSGALAGSVLDMASAVRNCSKLLNLKLDSALQMASLNPAKFLGIDKDYGSLDIGKKANMVLLDDEGKVLKTWVAGVSK